VHVLARLLTGVEVVSEEAEDRGRGWLGCLVGGREEKLAGEVRETF